VNTPRRPEAGPLDEKSPGSMGTRNLAEMRSEGENDSRRGERG
jgi:hypothetical protein